MNGPTCARPLAFPSGANASVKSPRCDEEKSVNLSQSWLNHVFRVFLSSEPKAFAMSKLSRQTRCSRVDSVPGVKPLPPPSTVLVGIHSNSSLRINKHCQRRCPATPRSSAWAVWKKGRCAETRPTSLKPSNDPSEADPFCALGAYDIGISRTAGSTRRALRSESHEKVALPQRSCFACSARSRHPSGRHNTVWIRIAIKFGLQVGMLPPTPVATREGVWVWGGSNPLPNPKL